MASTQRRKCMARKACMGLNLEVPWRTEQPLPVNFVKVYVNHYNEIMAGIEEHGSPYVGRKRCDLHVTGFFEESKKVPDVIRYRIDADDRSVRHDLTYRICDDRFIIPISCRVAEGGKCVPHDDRYLNCDTIRRCNHPEQANCHCDIYGTELDQLLQQPPCGSIVLLLESPHKDEYEYNGGRIVRHKAPASGSSGSNIDSCLGNVLSGIEEQQLIVPGRHVIISNPIQFQTSLHAIHEKSVSKSPWNKLRDNVWNTLWEEPQIEQDFRERLPTYSPHLIINACTGNWTPPEFLARTDDLTSKHGLKCLVTKFVRAELPTVPLYEAHHPAYKSWKLCNDIHLRRIYPQPNIQLVIPRDVQRNV